MVLLKVPMVALAPFRLAVPAVAVVMLAAPATLMIPPEKVGILVPAEKLVVPVPLRPPG